MSVGRTQVGTKFQNALSFDGSTTTSKMNAGSIFDATTNFTLCNWVYINAYGSGNSMIYSIGETGIGNGGYQYYITNAGVLRESNPGTAQSINTSTTLSIKTWYHLAMTCDGSGNQQMYINGVTAGGTTSSFNSPHGTYMDLGCLYNTSSTTFGNFFNGLIQDARYYTRLLTAAELLSLTNRTFPETVSTTNLVIQWTMNQSSGNPVDAIGGNILTVTNGSYVTGHTYLYNVTNRTKRTTFNYATGRSLAPI